MIADLPRRGISMRASGHVSAQDHGLTALPVAKVCANARSSRICASTALAWIHSPWPHSTTPHTANTAAMRYEPCRLNAEEVIGLHVNEVGEPQRGCGSPGEAG